MKRGSHPSIIISNRNFNRSISCGLRKREKWLVFPKDSFIWLINIYQKYTCCVLEVQTIKRYQMALTSGSWGQNKHFTTVSSRAANHLMPYHCLSDGWHRESLPCSTVVLWSGPTYLSSLLRCSGFLVPRIWHAFSEFPLPGEPAATLISEHLFCLLDPPGPSLNATSS